MNIQEYKALKEIPLSSWTTEQARAADRFVKETTIKNLQEILNKTDMPEVFKKWALQCASLHFGSVETDNMLVALNAYPEWM